MQSKWTEWSANLCTDISRLNLEHSKVSVKTEVDFQSIADALGEFQECVRYLNTRRSSGAVLKLDCEGAVQDAVYLILRPWVRDLIAESPTEKISNRYSIKDFISPSAETVIEIKYIRDEHHGKNVSREMHDDIEVYRHHPQCHTIIFFVYDPDSQIPDVSALKVQVETERRYNNRDLKCVLIVKP